MIRTAMGLKVDTANMPSCLSAQHFDDWIGRFARLGQRFGFVGISALLPTLTVRFSTEEKRETYGVYSLEEAKEEIRSLFPRKREIQAWLKECLPSIETKEDLWESAETLAYQPKKLFDAEYDGEAVYALIREIASAMKFSALRLGEYRHTQREIVLYTNSILQTRKNKTAEQAFEEVFAHELFHAYHSFYLHDLQNDIKDEDILSRRDQTREVVLESLASYYENLYCMRHNIPNDLRDVWVRNMPAIYPYAGAYYIQDDREFEGILQCSSDLDAALRKLLFRSDAGRRQFYMIKNGNAAEKIKEGMTIIPKGIRSCPKGCIDAVIEYCREKLNAEPSSSRSILYFYTDKMRAFFARHGEEIGSKLRIVCQRENDRIVIYLETKGKPHTSVALDLLRANGNFMAQYGSGRPGKEFSTLISRVKVIGLDELTDGAGRLRPLAAVAPAIDLNLRQFERKLFILENLLDAL